MKILDRYVIREMLGPFFIGVVGFILVMTVDLLFTMADLIINKGVPLLAVLKLLVYKLPSILVLTFPVSTLFGTTMAVGRFCKDNEMAAFRTSGVSLFRIARPMLLMGLLVSLLAFFTNEKIVPHANYVSSQIVRQVIQQQPLPEVKDNVFFKDAQNRFYYAGRVNMKNKTMSKVMIYEVLPGTYPRTILAESANFTGKIWELHQGVIHKYDEKGSLSYQATFERMKIAVVDNFDAFSEQKTFADMDRKELQGMIDSLAKSGSNTRALMTELYLKYSIPLTCFIFALVGIPFSLSSPRSGQTWGIVVTIVFMFTFYVFASVFRSLGKGGVLPPEIAAFAPQTCFMIIGFVMLYFQGRYR
ncbi:MAG: LptF/LptG family permease [Candidatus Margulisiibacteriota bacterium]|nr:LptF/LptG family permease [Thermoplasmata archaeon]